MDNPSSYHREQFVIYHCATCKTSTHHVRTVEAPGALKCSVCSTTKQPVSKDFKHTWLKAEQF